MTQPGHAASDVGGHDGDAPRGRTLPPEALWQLDGRDSQVSSLTGQYTVSVTLADATADYEEMVGILRDRLAQFQLLVTEDQEGTRLVLSIEAGDLWLAVLIAMNAVLIAMNAVTSTGYAAAAVTAEPASGVRPPGPDRGSAGDVEVADG